ncbi:Dbl homology domain-containing protein [Martensiomyces pterosporus]|nr:Dbl homology domain-containing protein [Martensiomyces pterosporus]
MYRIIGILKGQFDWIPANLSTGYFRFGPHPNKRHPQVCLLGTASNAVTVTRAAYMSPYDRAVELIERLLRLPSMAIFLYPILVDENTQNTHIYKDPTRPLRTLFEHGYTLNILLNEIESPFVATINLYDRVNEESYAEYQIQLFWRGCVDAGLEDSAVLDKFPGFDLAGDDEDLELTIMAVAGILDILQGRGRLSELDSRYIKPSSMYPTPPAAESGGPRYMELTAELSRTEVAYVQDLERLKSYAEQVKQLLDDAPHDVDTGSIFMHVDGILALHRKFSMGIQYLAAQHIDLQLYGTLYDDIHREFDIYSSFCASRECSQAAYSRALPILRQIQGELDPVIDVPALLMRPVQRLAQYPILFQNIIDAVCESCMFLGKPEIDERLHVIRSMYSAMRRSKRVLSRANEATREVQNKLAYAEFFERLDLPIPSGLRQGDFGRLLASGTMVVNIGAEPEGFEVFLFERNLVLCEAVDSQALRKPSRIRRTLSSLHLSVRSAVSRAKTSDRRRSASSISTAASSSRSTSRSRTLVADSGSSSSSSSTSPVSGMQSRESVFQPLTINTDSPLTLMAATARKLTSHASLAILPEQMGIRFELASDSATLPLSPLSPETPDKDSSDAAAAKKPGLFIREIIPTSCISQPADVDGSNSQKTH